MCCTYPQYYAIPDKLGDKLREYDGDHEHTILSEWGDIIFAECEWVDNLDSNELR